MTRFATGLACIILLSLSEAKTIFDKSEVISYADINGNPGYDVDINKCNDKPCQLYAVTRDLTDTETNIVLYQDKNVVVNLKDLASKNRPGYGLIQPFNLTAAPRYHLQNLNDPAKILSPFYIYVVQTDAEYIGTAVFDAEKTTTVVAPPGYAPYTATILSAADYFSLRNYVTPARGGVDVYTAGFDSASTEQSNIYRSTPFDDRERAQKSITTIVGPIATVRCLNADEMTTFSVQIDLTDRRNTTFERGATVVAMSPGYSGIDSNYPSELKGPVSYKFSLVKDYQIKMTVKSNTAFAKDNITVTATSDQTTHHFSYTGAAIKSGDKTTFDAHVIEVTWNHTKVGGNSYFLVQLESSATIRILPATVSILLIADILRHF